MAILITKDGMVKDWPLAQSDKTALAAGDSLITYERWDVLAAEKGSEDAVVAILKAVDTRQPSEKRPIKAIEEEGIKTK